MTLRPRKRKPVEGQRQSEQSTDANPETKRPSGGRPEGSGGDDRESGHFFTPHLTVTAFPSGQLSTFWHWGLARAIRQLALPLPWFAKPTFRPGPSPAQPAQPRGVPSSSPARQKPTACCHCSLGSSGLRPAVAGTAGPPGEPARQGESACLPSNCGLQVSTDPGFRESLG